MASTTDQGANADPFTQFWGDYFARVGLGAPQAPPSPGTASADAVKQMQRMFLDSLAKYCDDFMRSEQFLSMMKQSMDQSLAFKQQLDQFLTRLHQGSQSPSLTDITDLAGTLRNIESRILNRLSDLEHRVAAVEDGRGGKPAADRSNRDAGKARPRKAPTRRRK